MRDSRIEEPLSDAALDREIEQLLGAEPSPGFAARVRARVATEPKPARFAWPFHSLAAAGVVVAAVLVIVFVGPVPRSGPADVPRSGANGSASVIDLGRETPAGSADNDGRETRPTAPNEGRVPHSGPARVQKEPIRFAVVLAQPLVLPDVLISQDEQRALALLQRGPSKETAETDAEPRVPLLSPLAAIDIPDVEVAPLKQIAALELQGDRP